MHDEKKKGVSEVAAFPSFAEAACVWLRIGCLSFGGPAGQIALMHREVVDKRRWISDARFLHALNFCSLLPGPEAQQLAIYLGWLLHGVKGGVLAGLFFILPGTLVMLGLSLLFVLADQVPAVMALFFGLKAAVLAIVFHALLRIAARTLKGALPWALASTAFVALFLFNVSFPLVMLVSSLVGLAMPRFFYQHVREPADMQHPALLDAVIAGDPDYAKERAKSARRAGGTALVLWLAPLIALLFFGGFYAEVAWFFSKMAVLTFGGAYAVLTYVAQEAVEHYAWLTASEMLSGLGLAETTPGPLVLVLQFVSFLAGFGATTGFGSSLITGIMSTGVMLWMTVAPCFAFVFLGAPAIEQLCEKRALSGALSAITAAVVGVIANLALWFGLRVLFLQLKPVELGGLVLELPLLSSLDLAALCIVAVASLALFVFRWSVIQTLGICGLMGMIVKLGLDFFAYL